MRTRVVAFAGLVTVVFAGVPAGVQAGSASDRARAARLVPFDSCAQLTRYARRNVVRAGGRAGVPFTGDVVRPAVLPMPVLTDGQRMAAMDEASAPQPAQQQAATGGG